MYNEMSEKHTYSVNAIFPTSIYRTSIEKPLNKKQRDYIQKLKVRPNTGNVSTLNSFILDNKIFKNFKGQILEHVNNYLFNVLKYEKTFIPYITQSWVSYTGKNEFHHYHQHSNSFLSGVYYIEVDEKVDKIVFSKTTYDQIRPNIVEFNVLNAGDWFFNVKNKELFLFSSSVAHRVDVKKDSNIRISLAFNVFIKGKLGYFDDLNYLEV